MNKVKFRIKVFSKCSSKLAFVKHIKDITGLGLRESKDIVDSILEIPYKYVDIELPYGTDIKDFQKGIDDLYWEGSDINANYQIDGDLQWRRNFKILQLGAASKDEYSDFILESISNKFGNSQEILKFALNKLSKEDLIETINLYKY